MTRTAPPDRAGNGTLLAPWRDIEVGEDVKAMLRPVIALRLEWLRCVHEQAPTRAGRSREDYLEAWRSHNRTLADLERRLAAAYCEHRWDVRAAMPTGRIGGPGGTQLWDCRFRFDVDGVTVRFTEHDGLYARPDLTGMNYRQVLEATTREAMA